MRKFIAAVVFALIALPGWAGEDIVKVKASGDVASTMDALEAAVTGAGATVFARVDHAGGAAKVDMELASSQVLIFGNPKLGTPIMQADPLAGLFLPLKVLVYEDSDGQTWLAYQTPQGLLRDLQDIPILEVSEKISGALAKLTEKASGM